ncbi:MAG: UDP-N-acetylglucosamine 1-carboxyvinyltransferase [Lachnospiraceae bacterium]|nr:UDP-N-acetylglucosamine 1-carboxyvinyltransferase [Lachnospiraceae bacterium]
MEQYIVKGGNSLVGEVEISGAKNAALAILAASIMTDDTVTIENVPDVSDIRVLTQAIESIGAVVEHPQRHVYTINGSQILDLPVDNELIRSIRGSYYMIGALLGKHKNAQVALPGGCAIGLRPIDQHLKGFKALGAEVRVKPSGIVVATAKNLHGAHIYMDLVSVGATINVMMAASLAKGITIIENAAKEPHVVDLANFLNSMGARIRGAGTDVIRIKGVERLHGTEYAIIPDQIEAGTYMFAAAATRGDVTITNVIPKHMESISAKLKEIGCQISESDDAIRVVATGRLQPTNVKTMPYPGFPTDMQPQVVVLLGLSNGTSIVTEGVFENRFRYVDELMKMGAKVTVEGRTAIIDGQDAYTPATMSAPDLRAGAALVIAALSADGISKIDNIHYVERGYEDFPEKLRAIGGEIIKTASKEEESSALRRLNLKAIS